MKNIIIGNGIDIQFGGTEYHNTQIINRLLTLDSDEDFPRDIIIDEPNSIKELINLLFDIFPKVISNGYDKFALFEDMKFFLNNFKYRYADKTITEPTAIGVEDYFLLLDLWCKSQMDEIDHETCERAIIGLKSAAIYSIYYKGTINEIYKNYPPNLLSFLGSFDNIFTTNYDTNLDKLTKGMIYHLHGSFDTLDDGFDPAFAGIKASIPEIPEGGKYNYLFSNAVMAYSGNIKKLILSRNENANYALNKLAASYLKDSKQKEKFDKWKDDPNQVTRQMYVVLMKKIINPEFRIPIKYPLIKFNNISDEISILGLSPINDLHIFSTINSNSNISKINYYYYDEAECQEIDKILDRKNVDKFDVKDFWSSLD